MQHRVKKRVQYLLAKAGLRTTSIAGCLLLLIAGLGAVGFAGGLIAAIVFFGFRMDIIIRPVVGLIISVLMGLINIMICRRAVDKLDSMAYVPPIHDSFSGLPSSAVLVRGSDQPVANPGELLRASEDASDTEPKQLVRASDVEPLEPILTDAGQ